MAVLGIVTGLAAETRALKALPPGGWRACCAGARPERAGELARELLAAGCEGLVSFGIAGGLDPGARTGTVVIADRVAVEGGTFASIAPGWAECLARRAPTDLAISRGVVFGGTLVLATPAEKQRLFQRTGAVAVDMETGAVAEMASAGRKPFLVLRAIADPFDRTLPGWLAGVTNEAGEPLPGAVIAGLLRHPFDLPRLIGLGRETARALAALRRLVAAAGPLLDFHG